MLFYLFNVKSDYSKFFRLNKTTKSFERIKTGIT